MQSVIVFTDPDDPDGETIEVYAIPDGWSQDDTDRFIRNHKNGEWIEAAVVDVKLSAVIVARDRGAEEG
jgi:hypothetical protein